MLYLVYAYDIGLHIVTDGDPANNNPTSSLPPDDGSLDITTDPESPPLDIGVV